MRCEAPSGLFSSYSMRPRKIFVLLHRELLKQKLQTKNYQIIEKKSAILFSEAIANVDKATRPGSPLCLQLVRSDPRLDTIAIQIICVIQELL